MREIKKSGEDYLEAIYLLEKEKEQVRSVDLVHHLSFSKSSVSAAVNLLEQEGLLTIEQNGMLHLTANGKETAQRVYEKHCVLKNFLLVCGVSAEVAEEEACKMEHTISADSIEKIRCFFLRYQNSTEREKE